MQMLATSNTAPILKLILAVEYQKLFTYFSLICLFSRHYIDLFLDKRILSRQTSIQLCSGCDTGGAAQAGNCDNISPQSSASAEALQI